MTITKKYYVLLIFISIIGIIFGMSSIMDIDEKFNGLIINKNGNILDIESYFNTQDGKAFMIDYLNTHITNDNNNFYIKDKTKFRLINSQMAKWDPAKQGKDIKIGPKSFLNWTGNNTISTMCMFTNTK